ncbi:hypothetical protein CALVIDRAFT_532603 [Calocera viscosa TUFC12733]|uniref:F-box domain-containing protein n=1 Tax=Calocera viscosa (strain TUFC12733) TaxID=1330018 RepID=A0A167SF44_CALVF|nr:hypothetical protein CALVIDRAFT_532603 [Calocera viscosa TUFC12733]
MHRAWLVDDIVEIIVEALYKRHYKCIYDEDCVALMRVSKNLFWLTAKSFWRKTTVSRLLHLISVCTEDEEQGWSRFEKYASFVQVLDIEGDRERSEYDPLWDITVNKLYRKLETCPWEPKLPFLGALQNVYTSAKFGQLDLAEMLACSTLQEVSIWSAWWEFDPGPGHVDALAARLADLWHGLRQISSITTLKLCLYPCSEELDRFRLDAVSSFTGLRSLQLSWLTVTWDLLTSLAQLPELQHLDLLPGSEDVGLEPFLEPFLEHLQAQRHDNTFPQLTSFHWTGEWSDAVQWILSRSFTLERVRLNLGPPSDISHLAPLLELSRETLKYVDADATWNGQALPNEAFTSLIRCEKIQSLSLRCDADASSQFFSDTQARAMAQSWPSLQCLDLQIVSEDLADGAPGIDVLRPFAASCPYIHTLNIPAVLFPDNLFPVLENRPTLNCRRGAQLRIEGLRPLNTNIHPIRVALYLAQLWPDRHLHLTSTALDYEFWDEINGLLEFPREDLTAYYDELRASGGHGMSFDEDVPVRGKPTRGRECGSSPDNNEKRFMLAENY